MKILSMRKIFKTLSFILLLEFIIGCNHISENANKSKYIQERNTLFQKYIKGVWALKEGENARFEIIGDSIFYVEHPDSKATYKIINDTFIIFYDDSTSIKSKIIKLDADSFVDNSGGYINRFYRRKK